MGTSNILELVTLWATTPEYDEEFLKERRISVFYSCFTLSMAILRKPYDGISLNRVRRGIGQGSRIFGCSL